jgi:hypothetical protein
MKGIKTISMLCIALLLGCNTNSTQYFQNAFYNQTNNKLWAHRVNSPQQANLLSKEFPGVEIDVFFHPETSIFEVKHDAHQQGVSLEQYLSEVKTPEKLYYWIDCKNLNLRTRNKAARRLKKIIGQFNLENHVIIESKRPGALKAFAKKGIFTSFWIPKLANKSKGIDLWYWKRKIKKHINSGYVYCISAHYSQLGFINENFNHFPVHIWTNEMTRDSDKAIIGGFARDKDVKVILTDFKENFLFSSPNN